MVAVPPLVLPEALVERARAFYAGAEPAVAPKASATVMLLRDGAGGLEVYLLRRVTSMAFAAGMYAFPGGGVDPRDADADLAWTGSTVEVWADRLGVSPELARALVAAAVRETFEEAGVLLAGPSPDAVVGDMRDESWEADRLALLDRSQALSELLETRGLVLRADLLRPWAHWITPEFEPRRYDTSFFVAALPAEQQTRHVGGEADRVVWMRPADVVQGYLDGELGMFPPTLVAVSELAAFDSVAAALAADRSTELDVKTPRVLFDTDHGHVLVLPGDERYDAAQHRTDG